MMTSEDPFLLACTVFVKSLHESPNMGLLIDRTSDGLKVAIYRSTTEVLSVDVNTDTSTLVLINKLFSHLIVLAGNQQSKPKHTLRPSANDRLSQAGLRRYKGRGGRSTKKT